MQVTIEVQWTITEEGVLTPSECRDGQETYSGDGNTCLDCMLTVELESAR